MPLLSFSCKDFRCLAGAEFSPHERFTLIHGANASGKTSLLEAVAYLGRGKSFRGAAPRDLVRHGAVDFLLNGRVLVNERQHRLGVQNGRAGLQQSVDGDRGGGTAALAAMLPLQVIDPEVHRLVGGAPEERRRFLDWMAFHVEHGFLETWRGFRRVLKQRNALLKEGSGDLGHWDREFCERAEAVESARQGLLERALPVLEEVAGDLLGAQVGFDYHRGWAEDRPLVEVIKEGRGRDLQAGSTQAGPHRADLKPRYGERLARRLVSRGQQKLLASSMVLGSVRVVAEGLSRQPLLLLDDPAAELDAAALERLMAAVGQLDGQVIATALTADAVPVPAELARFHVERGELTAE